MCTVESNVKAAGRPTQAAKTFAPTARMYKMRLNHDSNITHFFDSHSQQPTSHAPQKTLTQVCSPPQHRLPLPINTSQTLREQLCSNSELFSPKHIHTVLHFHQPTPFLVRPHAITSMQSPSSLVLDTYISYCRPAGVPTSDSRLSGGPEAHALPQTPQPQRPQPAASSAPVSSSRHAQRRPPRGHHHPHSLPAQCHLAPAQRHGAHCGGPWPLRAPAAPQHAKHVQRGSAQPAARMPPQAPAWEPTVLGTGPASPAAAGW